MASILIGRKIGGRYEIRHLLGEGGMAEVYAGYQTSLDRLVAVKLLHRHLSRDEQFRVRFEREAQAIARLKHPHIVQVYDFDLDSDLNQYYMVIEYIDGPTLGDRIKAVGGALPLSESIQIMQDLTGALSYAHQEAMLHRDIKPSNVMLDRGTRTVLTDFGIAKLVRDTGQQLTASGAMVGTPAYISPEQASGLAGDHRSDIYSLGIVFYQLVTGRLPYEGDTPISTILKHINEVPDPPSAVNPNIPPGVEAVILRCIAKDPEARYQKAEDMLAHLRDLSAAAIGLDEARTMVGKMPADDLFRTTTLRTPTGTSNPGLTVPRPSATGEYITDSLATAPRRTSLIIGIGAVAIIALLALGAILFSTAGSNSNPGTEDESLNACIFTLENNLAGRLEPNSETSASEVMTAGATVEIDLQVDDFYLVMLVERADDDDASRMWVANNALALPDGCEP